MHMRWIKKGATHHGPLLTSQLSWPNAGVGAERRGNSQRPPARKKRGGWRVLLNAFRSRRNRTYLADKIKIPSRTACGAVVGNRSHDATTSPWNAGAGPQGSGDFGGASGRRAGGNTRRRRPSDCFSRTTARPPQSWETVLPPGIRGGGMMELFLAVEDWRVGAGSDEEGWLGPP